MLGSRGAPLDPHLRRRHTYPFVPGSQLTAGWWRPGLEATLRRLVPGFSEKTPDRYSNGNVLELDPTARAKIPKPKMHFLLTTLEVRCSTITHSQV